MWHSRRPENKRKFERRRSSDIYGETVDLRHKVDENLAPRSFASVAPRTYSKNLFPSFSLCIIFSVSKTSAMEH